MKNQLFVALVLVLSACNLNNNQHVLEPADFKAKVSEANAQILDIRDEADFKKGHIANAVNISSKSTDFEAQTASLYSDVPTYIYGNTEAEAMSAAQTLGALEFKKLFVLKGGVSAWTAAGLALEAEKPRKIYESDTIPFEEARKGSKLVMVDFNATWCKPCKMLEPFVHRLHDNRDAEVIVYSIDVDQRRDLAMEYSANSIPLLVFIKNNKILYRSEGYIDEAQLNSLVDQYK